MLFRMWVRAAPDDLRQARKAILRAVAEQAVHWSEAEKRDYSTMVYFELVDGER